MADDIRITNRDDLEKWLNSQPEDIRQQAAPAIGSRATLRVFPTLEIWLARNEEEAISVILPVLRATATSWLAAIGLTLYHEGVRKAAARAAPPRRRLHRQWCCCLRHCFHRCLVW